MHRNFRITAIVGLAMILFSACNHIPDHARYIPKDAVAVAGINLKSLSKKIAWNMITGSKLFKEMQSRIPEKSAKDAMSGIEKAGLDVINTIYIYVKADTRFTNGSRVTALIPLSDAGQWESYVKMAFPNVEIKDHGTRKEASLNRDMYAGWNKNLLIIINVMPSAPDYTSMAMGKMSPDQQPDKPTVDLTTIAAEMDKAFTLNNENAITTNKRFQQLESEGHDVTFWINYDQLMTQMSGDMAQKVGMSLSAELWKDAAFAAGFDFRKGAITSDMKYYMSPSMKDIGNELGGTNADADMIARLPNQNMDMMATFHLSPKGFKDMLEKMNLLGLANLGLSSQNMTVDYVLDAFTGDMAFVMNDFSLHAENVTDTFMSKPIVHQNQKATLSMSYVVKINKKDNFQALVKLAKNMGLHSTDNGFVIPIDDKDSVYIMINDQYLVASNKLAHATGFLQGTFKSQKLPEPAATQVPGHPVAFFFDVQQFCKNIDPAIAHSARDSFMISESKNLLNNISFQGGSFKNDAFDYHLDINFMNTEENSIIQLLDYSMKMNDAAKMASE